jgi:thiopurine S-methyltransferase
MEPKFWRDRWEAGDIGFHQADVHDLLIAHWPRLGLPPGSAVFVPLCGKSRDMAWLAANGHRVIGCELAEVAVDAFFAEQGLEPAVEQVGAHSVKRAGPYEIWCGDVFELPASVTAEAAAVYDRAALIAFPPPFQKRYAIKLMELVPDRAPILLVALAFDQSEVAGPPFSTGLQTILFAFGPGFRLTLLESRDGLEKSENLRKRGLTRLVESIYRLDRVPHQS